MPQNLVVPSVEDARASKGGAPSGDSARAPVTLCKVMKRMNLRMFGAVALTIALAATGLRADVIEQVLVKINGEILTKTDIEQLQVTALRANNPNISAADLENDAALRRMLD